MLLEPTLVIQAREYGPDHLDVAVTFTNLGPRACEEASPTRFGGSTAQGVRLQHYGPLTLRMPAAPIRVEDFRSLRRYYYFLSSLLLDAEQFFIEPNLLELTGVQLEGAKEHILPLVDANPKMAQGADCPGSCPISQNPGSCSGSPCVSI